jgi:hypothetical protein
MHAIDNETLSLNTLVLVRTVKGADSKPRTTARDSRRLKQATARSKRNVRTQMSQLELQRRPDTSRTSTRCQGQHFPTHPGPRGRRSDESTCQTTHERVRRSCLRPAIAQNGYTLPRPSLAGTPNGATMKLPSRYARPHPRPRSSFKVRPHTTSRPRLH